MSYQTQLHRTVRVAALSLGLALLGLPAFAQDAAQSDYSDYYASIGNPHPELPGFPKIRRSDNRIYANVFDRCCLTVSVAVPQRHGSETNLSPASGGAFSCRGHGRDRVPVRSLARKRQCFVICLAPSSCFSPLLPPPTP